MDSLITPENLQIAGLAVVSVSLVWGLVAIVKFFLDRTARSMDNLNLTLSNHYADLRGLITGLTDFLQDFREEIRHKKK